jgi:hypothetical protein
VIPRLKAAGADLARIKFINRVRTQEFDEKDGKKSEVRRLQLSEDVKKLRMAIEARPQVALLVIDTLTSYFGVVNANADQDIRPVMDALAKAFGDCGACFLGVIHHKKKSDVDALQAILGASFVAGAVRSAYSCSRDPENDDDRQLDSTRVSFIEQHSQTPAIDLRKFGISSGQASNQRLLFSCGRHPRGP